MREARDGKEGLDQYRKEPADVVIMDVMMPDQDGLESILILRREFPASSRVIAITGGSNMIGILNVLDVAKMMGTRNRLHKPFKLHDLLDAVAAEIAA